jgi:hypothetical protein
MPDQTNTEVIANAAVAAGKAIVITAEELSMLPDASGFVSRDSFEDDANYSFEALAKPQIVDNKPYRHFSLGGNRDINLHTLSTFYIEEGLKIVDKTSAVNSRIKEGQTVKDYLIANEGKLPAKMTIKSRVGIATTERYVAKEKEIREAAYKLIGAKSTGDSIPWYVLKRGGVETKKEDWRKATKMVVELHE